MPALALQIAIASPMRKVDPRVTTTFRQNAPDLILDNAERAVRHHERETSQVVGDRGGIGKQRVARYECRDGRKDRQQAVEYDTSGCCKNAVFVDLLKGAIQDVLPSGEGDLPRGARQSATSDVCHHGRAACRCGTRIGFVVLSHTHLTVNCDCRHGRCRNERKVVRPAGASHVRFAYALKKGRAGTYWRPSSPTVLLQPRPRALETQDPFDRLGVRPAQPAWQ